MLNGGCLCGAVRYAYSGTIEQVIACHCLACRKAQGTPFVTNAPIEAAKFQLLSGHDALKSYSSSAGKNRVFCGTCGSPIYSRLDAMPNILRLRLGSLESPLPVNGIGQHIFVSDKANWWTIHDSAPQHATWMP